MDAAFLIKHLGHSPNGAFAAKGSPQPGQFASRSGVLWLINQAIRSAIRKNDVCPEM
jgi:hypothetical protein